MHLEFQFCHQLPRITSLPSMIMNRNKQTYKNTSIVLQKKQTKIYEMQMQHTKCHYFIHLHHPIKSTQLFDLPHLKVTTLFLLLTSIYSQNLSLCNKLGCNAICLYTLCYNVNKFCASYREFGTFVSEPHHCSHRQQF